MAKPSKFGVSSLYARARACHISNYNIKLWKDDDDDDDDDKLYFSTLATSTICWFPSGEYNKNLYIYIQTGKEKLKKKLHLRYFYKLSYYFTFLFTNKPTRN